MTAATKKRYEIEIDREYMGYRYIVAFQSHGHRCGYVGIPPGNPLHGVKAAKLNLRVHGGLTFCSESFKTEYPVESNLWWLGFDCAHYRDGIDCEQAVNYGLMSRATADRMIAIYSEAPIGGEVRTAEYVEKECQQLIGQIIDLTSGRTKTLDGWHESGQNLYDYLTPGDDVDELLVDYQMNAVPPRSHSSGYLQVGEAYSDAADENGSIKPIYATFHKIGEIWHYAGNCFVGETTDRTPKRTKGEMQCQAQQAQQ